MKLIRTLLLSVLLLAALSPVSDAAFTERLKLQVFDQQFRPVEGASAYVEYQLNAVAGDIKTKPVLTGPEGEVLLNFTNYEEIPGSVSYAYTLYVKYGDQLKTYSMIAGENGTRAYTSQVDSYFVFLRVHDQKGAPLASRITVGGKAKDTDTLGAAIFQLPPGNYTVRVEHENIVVNRGLLADGDKRIDFTVGLYPLIVRVSDDAKKPLVATVEVMEQQVKTGTDGIAKFYNLSEQKPEVTVQYKDSVKKYTPDLAVQGTVEAVFDLNRPVVKELHASVGKTGSATIGLFVDDPGVSASGIDTVLVSYEVDGVENSVPAYGVGYNAFEAKIPAQKPGTYVRYSVRVADKDGNVGIGSGTYSITAEQPANQTQPPQPQGGIGLPNISTETIILAIVTFAIIAYGVFYYFTKKRQEMAPPSAPPQA